MNQQLPPLKKTLATCTALTWFLPSVYCLMFYQIISTNNTHATYTALIWLLPSMHYLVLYMIRTEGEKFITIVTFIWFLPSVYFLMFQQPHFLETIVTLITLLWLLPNKHSLVYYKMISHDEPFVTGCNDTVFLKSVFSSVPYRAKHFSHCLH